MAQSLPVRLLGTTGILLMAVVAFAVLVLWPIMRMPVTIANQERGETLSFLRG